MGQQILLFKLELCPEIKSLFQHHFISRPFAPLAVEHAFDPPPAADSMDQKFRNESSFETSKCDGFADDNTAGTLFDYNSLSALKNVLDEFALFSGLKCNTEKTVLMQVGNKPAITEEIRSLGFVFSDSIHILGMDIDSELVLLDENFEKTISSLKKSIEFWNRFHLTLPGRINVIKSLLMSQVIYLGSFIMPSPEKLKKIQDLLDNFALGKLNFAKNRISLPREQGGMGLFNVENFLMAQQAGWIFKAEKSSRDNWRAKLRQLCYNNVLCAGPDLISKNANPILHNLSISYERIRISHDSLHSNFTAASIINHKLFFRGPGDKLTLDHMYLETSESNLKILSRIPAHEFFNVNGIKTRIELNMDSGANLSIETYVKLASCLNHFVRRMRPNNRNNGSSMSISENFLHLKRPGKKIRESITKKRRTELDVSKSRTVTSFCTITQTVSPTNDIVGTWLGLWNTGGISNRIKTFLFKFYNNLLGLNTRVSHFVATQSRACTFCDGHGITVPPDEKFNHLFMECPTTFDWHCQFLGKYFPHLIYMDAQQRRSFFFWGRLPGEGTVNKFLVLSVLIFQWCVWEEKLRKKTPSFYTIDNIFAEHIFTLTSMNRKIYSSAEKLNLPLCRLAGIRDYNIPQPRWIPVPTIPPRRP